MMAWFGVFIFMKMIYKIFGFVFNCLFASP